MFAKTTWMNAIVQQAIPVHMDLALIPMEATIANVSPAGPVRIAKKTPTFVNRKTLALMVEHVCPRWLVGTSAVAFQDTLAICARSMLTSALAIPVSMVAIVRMGSMDTHAVVHQHSLVQLVDVREDSQVIIAPKKSTNVTLNLVRTMPVV